MGEMGAFDPAFNALSKAVWSHLCPIMRLRVLGHRSVPVSVELIAA